MFTVSATSTVPVVRYASRLAALARKPRSERIKAVKATILHYYRAAVGKPTKWQDSENVRKIIAGDMVLPTVLRSESPFYTAYRPDSDFKFDVYPELRSLADRWTENNSFNNAGDLTRLYALAMNIRQVMSEGVEGDFAELGVYRGNSAVVLAHYARLAQRTVYLFDTFEGFSRSDLTGTDANKTLEFQDTSLEMVRSIVGEDSVEYVRGHFPGTVTEHIAARTFAVVHLDCDLYEPLRAGLEFFYPRLSVGGLIIIHDYDNPAWQGAKRAVDEYLCQITENLIRIPDKSGTAMLRKANAIAQPAPLSCLDFDAHPRKTSCP